MSQPLTAHEGYYDIPELQADVGDKVLTENEKKLKTRSAAGVGADHLRGLRRSILPGGISAAAPTTGELAMAYTGDEAIARLLFDGAHANP